MYIEQLLLILSVIIHCKTLKLLHLAMRMAALIGKIGEFQQGQEEWTQYCERLEHYFAANGVVEAERNDQFSLQS